MSGLLSTLRQRFARHAAISLIDQAWLSALNLGLGLLLIRLATKEDYGIYAQLYLAGVFVASMGEALVANPLLTLAAGRSDTQRRDLIAHATRFQGMLAWGAAALAGLGCTALAFWLRLDAPLALGAAFGAYVKVSAAREFQRSVSFFGGQPRQVLHMDLCYGGVLVLAMAVLALTGHLALWAVMAVLAVANGVALAGSRSKAAASDPPEFPHVVAQLWRRGRLGMPGALLSWIINYSYLYIAAAWLGVAASADLNASRLLLMPITLAVVAWSRVARPAFTRCLAPAERPRLRKLVFGSLIAIEGMTLAYVAVLWLALPWLQAWLLGPQYAAADLLVPLWCVYFVLNAARSVYTSVLICQDRYGLLLAMTAGALAVLLVAIGPAMHAWAAAGAIAALIAAEAASLFMVWRAYRAANPANSLPAA